MPNLISLLFKCTKCPATWGDTIPREERGKTGWTCPSCGEASGVETVSAPYVMNPNIAKPDGSKRKGWQELKESAKLEMAIQDMRPEEKARAKSEMNKIVKSMPKGEF